MADVDDLLLDIYSDPATAAQAPVPWSDYGKSLGAGLTKDVIGGTAAGVQYLTGGDETGIAAGVRRWANEAGDAIDATMTPQGQRAAGAGVLPDANKPDIWDDDVRSGSAIGLKIARSAPGMLVSLIPGALLGRAVGAVGGYMASGAISGAQTGGALYNELVESVQKASPEDLAKSSIYNEMIASGFTDAEARHHMIESMAGEKPLIMGFLTALLGPVGAEGTVVRSAARAGMGGRGIVGRAVTGAGREGATEAIEEGAQDYMTQSGKVSGGLQEDVNLYDTLQSMATGAVVGGAMGGGIEVAVGKRPYRAEVTDEAGVGSAEQAALAQADALKPEAPQPDPAAAAPPVPPAPAAPAAPAAQPVTPPAAAPSGVAAVRQGLAETPPLAGEPAPGQTAPPPTEAPPSAATPARPTAPQAAAPIPQTAPAAPDPGAAPPVEMAGSVEEIPPAPPTTVDPRTAAVIRTPPPKVAAAIETARRRAAPPVTPTAQFVEPISALSQSAVPDAAPAEGPVEAVAPRPPTVPTEAATATTPAQEVMAKARRKRAPKAVVVEEAPAVVDTPEVTSKGNPDEETPAIAEKEPEAEPRRVLPDLRAQDKLKKATDEQIKEWLLDKGVKPDLSNIDNDSSGERMKAAEAARVATGEAVAWNLPKNDAEFASDAGRKRLKTAVRNILAGAEKAGVQPPAWAVKAKAAQDIIKTQRAKGGKDLRAAWQEALADTKRIQEEDARKRVRETQKEAAKRERRERREADTAKAKELFERLPMPPVKRNTAELDGEDIKKFEEYARDVVKEARTAGITIPEKGERDPDGELIEDNALIAHLRTLRSIGVNGASSNMVRNALINDVLIRAGQYDLVDETRKVDGDRSSRQGDGIERNSNDNDGKDALEERDEIRDEFDDVPADEEIDSVDLDDDDVDDSPPAVTSIGKVEPDDTPEVRGGAKRKAVLEKIGQRRKLAEVKIEKPIVLRKRGAPEPEPDPEPPKKAKKVRPKKVTDAISKAKKLARGGDRSDPTDAMKEAGNYKKETVRIPGEVVSIESPKGSVRSGVTKDGTRWSVTMPADYGYIRRTTGKDGDQVDVYMGPNARSPALREFPVYIVDQVDADTGKFDEHKVLLGFNSREEALATYEAGFSDGRGIERVGSIAEMDYADFREWVTSRGTKRPAIRDGRAITFDGPEVEAPQPETRTIGDIFREIGPPAEDNLAGVMAAHVFKRVLRAIPDVEVVIMDDQRALAEAADMLESGEWTSIPDGWYEADSDRIFIREKFVGDFADLTELLIHEGLHALYHHTIDRSPKETKAILSMIERTRAFLIAEARSTGASDVRMPYGLRNEHEFISEAFSNPDFQALLERVPARASDIAGAPRNLWDTLLTHLANFIRRFKGEGDVPLSMLDAVVRMEGALWKGRQAGTSGGKPSPARFTKDEIIPLVSDRASASKSKFWRWVRKGATLDQLRQAGARAKLFVKDGVDHLDGLVRKAQRAYEFQRQERIIGERHATRFAAYAAKNPQEAARLGDVMLEASRLNVNIVGSNDHLSKVKRAQAEVALPKLKSDYAALSAEGKAMFNELTNYFRETQNRMADKNVRNLLKYMTKLSPKTQNALAEKLLKGTFNDEDAKIVDDEKLVGALKNAAQLKALKGVYFPFMRHGNFVVTAHTAIKDLMGGVLEGRNVVTFRGNSRVDMRKKAEEFAKHVFETQGLTVEATSLRAFDPATGKRIKLADAIRLTTPVEWEARVSVQTRSMFTFDSEADAYEFIRSERKNYAGEGDYIDSRPLVKTEFEAGPEMTTKGLDTLLSSISKRDDIDGAQKAALRQSLHDATLMMMSGFRVQHTQNRRRNVRGFSEDIARSTGAYADMAARTLSKLEFQPGMTEDLMAMRKMAEDRDAREGLRAERSEYLQEVERRIEGGDFNPKQPSKFISDLLTITMLDKLFSPAYSVVNALQVAMVTYPYLAGRYGMAQTTAAITRAYRDIGITDATMDGLVNTVKATKQWANLQIIDARDIFGDIKKAINNPAEAAMIDALINRGAMGGNAAFEVAHAEMQGRKAWGRALSKVDRIARQLPLAVEDINRSVTALATYRLAMASGKTAAEATDIAFDAVQNTQGDYRAMNAPPLFNAPLMRPALQFKKYAQLMTAMVGEMAYRSFKDASPRERRIAQKQLMHLISVQVAMAGALSLPGIEIAKAGFLIAAALGFGDGWEDQERKLRKTAEESLGKEWGTLVSRGVISRAIGLDLSTRLSLADMWLPFGEPQKYDTNGLLGYAAKFGFGASGATVLDWFDAVRLGGEGEWGRAAMKAVPIKFVSDSVQAYDKAMKGEITTGEGALKAFGFQSGRMADEGEARGISIARTRKLADDYSRLSRRYRDASTPAERVRVMIEIKKHNAQAPLRYKVFPQALDRGRAADQKRREALTAGR